MTDKQPLLGEHSAPPPPYNPAQAPPYPPDPPPQQAAPPAYSSAYSPAYPPPPQMAPYGSTATHTNVTVVQQVRPVGAQVVIEAKPPNHIVLSVVVLFFFCWIFGLIALIMGMQVDSAWASGDRSGARRMSAAARGWNIAGMIVGGIVYVLIVVSAVASTAAGGA